MIGYKSKDIFNIILQLKSFVLAFGHVFYDRYSTVAELRTNIVLHCVQYIHVTGATKTVILARSNDHDDSTVCLCACTDPVECFQLDFG